jgi:hypothetical protein
MGIDFRVMRLLLLARLDRLYWRIADRKLALIRRVIGRLRPHDKARAAELEAEVQEIAEKSKKHQEWTLYTAIGQTLCQWATMEEMLVGIASLLLRTGEFSKVGTIMYSIVNFNTWLGIIEDLFLQEPRYVTLTPKWTKLSDRIRGLKTTRDRLAHHTIYRGDKVGTISGDTSLRPGRFDLRKSAQKHQPLDYDQIHEFSRSLDVIHNDITKLLEAMTDLLNRETSQQKSS